MTCKPRLPFDGTNYAKVLQLEALPYPNIGLVPWVVEAQHLHLKTTIAEAF